MTMNCSHANQHGLLESLQRVSGSFSTLLRNRFELFTVEFQEEKLRVLKMLIWFGVALAIGMAGILMALLALAFWVWSTAGYLGLLCLTLAALISAWLMILRMQNQIQSGPTPFAQTVDEFRKDCDGLRNVK